MRSLSCEYCCSIQMSTINTDFQQSSYICAMVLLFSCFKICCTISYLVLKSVNLQLQAGQFFCFLNITVIDTNTHLNCVDKTLVKLFFFPLIQIFNQSFQIKCRVMPETINLLCHWSLSISCNRLIPIKEVLFSHLFIKFNFPV